MDVRKRFRLGERLRQAKWDAAHLRTVSTKLSVAECKCLHDACARENTTAYALMRKLLRGWLMDFARREPDAAEHIMVSAGV